MKIAIISDTHDNLVTTEKALKWIKKHGIKTLIHCGDLCAPTFLTQFLVKKFTGQIHLVHGNVGDKKMLSERAKVFSNVKLYNNETGDLKVGEKRIAFTHKADQAKELAQTGKYDIVFYGHTHRPWEDRLRLKPTINILNKKNQPKYKSVRLVNPGTLAGMFYRATFAIYDPKTDKLELKILDRI